MLVLTATVSPQVALHTVALSDPDTRRRQYAESLRYWVALQERADFDLVFAENSGEDLRRFARVALGNQLPERLHLVECPLPDESRVERGKGALEGAILDHVIAGLDPDTNVLIYKLTGRLTLRNWKRCLEARSTSSLLLVDVPRGNFDWVDSRLFGASLDIWNRYLCGSWEKCDDRIGVNMETVLAQHTHILQSDGRVRTFKAQPSFGGSSGTTGASYQNALFRVRRLLLAPLSRIRRALVRTRQERRDSI